MTDLADIRRAYAIVMMNTAGVEDAALEAAFAAVPREAFLGPPPWQVITARGYQPVESVRRLYADVLVGLKPERQLNNGQPSGHALWIASAAPQPGEHIVHVGAGTGYYSAILAELAGKGGAVTAIEIDGELAARARENLRAWPTVTVVEGDGAAPLFAPADVIYVNAGATHPAPAWLDGLKPGGRLVLPLTAISAGMAFPAGAVFRITREGDGFAARWVSPTAFYPCEGMRDAAISEALAAAFKRGGQEKVTRLIRSGEVADADAWLRTPEWSLLY